MTCIVGIAKDGKVYMGADSLAGSTYSYSQAGGNKIFKNGPFIIGCTTSFRMIDLLHYSLKVETQSGSITDEAFMRTVFINSVKTCFKDNHWLKANDGQHEGGNFLVGYNGFLYEVQSDFSVLNTPDWGQTVGSGEYEARGSLHTTRHHWDCRDRIIKALEAAEASNPFVRHPFTILEN